MGWMIEGEKGGRGWTIGGFWASGFEEEWCAFRIG
jgi:hypothetical protein